jgi:hypothetical protein
LSHHTCGAVAHDAGGEVKRGIVPVTAIDVLAATQGLGRQIRRIQNVIADLPLAEQTEFAKLNDSMEAVLSEVRAIIGIAE